MTILPVQAGSASTPTTPTTPTSTSLTVDEAELQILDPWERARRTADLAEVLHRLSGVVLGLRRQAVRELVEHHRQPKTEVARLIGVSPTRICQMVRERTSTSADAEAVA